MTYVIEVCIEMKLVVVEAIYQFSTEQLQSTNTSLSTLRSWSDLCSMPENVRCSQGDLISVRMVGRACFQIPQGQLSNTLENCCSVPQITGNDKGINQNSP